MNLKTIQSRSEEVFAHSISNVLSHTIKGLETTLSNDYAVKISIKIFQDDFLGEVEGSLPFCYIDFDWTNHINFHIDHIDGKKKQLRHDSLDACIFIHPDTERDAARFAICHEIYHLVMELNHFKKYKTPRNRFNEMDTFEFLCGYREWLANKGFTQDTPNEGLEKMYWDHYNEENEASVFASLLCNHLYRFTHEKCEIEDLHQISEDFKDHDPKLIDEKLKTLKRGAINKERAFTKRYKFEEILKRKY